VHARRAARKRRRAGALSLPEAAGDNSHVASRWLFGARSDLLLGCGLAWIAVSALQGAVGSDRLAAWVPAGLLVMSTSIPHYGATLLRVYESGAERRKYAFFAFHTSLALALLFALGLRSAWLGSLLLTVYLTWSPWHYTGQNYGIALMLLGRRGVAVSPRAKRLVYGSFVLSYALTFVALHGVELTGNYAPVSYADTVFRLLPLRIPAALCAVLVPALVAGYLACLFGAALGLARVARTRDLAPAALLALTQALWFALPVALRHFGLVDRSSFLANTFTPYGFLWVATAHAVQYLWITTYFARTSGSERSTGRYLAKTLLAGYAIWVLPGLLFAPGLLGRVPYESGLALLIAAMVNLHHFILDGAIWKLRDGAIARVLLRSAPDDARPLPAGRPWRSRLVYGAGALSVLVTLFAFYEGAVGHERALARQDLARAREAAQRLRWIGRDGPGIHRQLGRALANRGQVEAARSELERSLALFPTAGAWLDLATLADARGDRREALRCREAALALEPDHVGALYATGLAYLESGEHKRALEHLRRAAELAPQQGVIHLALERALRERARSLARPRP
jgi:tetratricopeptide (TPR) repeat protein